ncbi:MAG TPA: hypothetical protein VEV21_01735 [Burkholderiales bacterium]|jgi:hypothetical protein|nr:hypothetical protein [Burkholderiales bacterium]
MSDDAQTALMRFDFRSGPERGSQLMLYPRYLVHRSDSHVETVPFSRVTALRVAFERDSRRLGWGVALVIVALLMLAIAAPIGSLAHAAAQEMMASAQGVARALYSLFRFIEGVAALLPAIALAAALGGAALGVLGWRGSTMLTLVLGGAERAYSVRGRDTLLLDFAEMAAERLMATTR